MTIPGKLITFEGIEGTGKSTQIQLLKNFLDQKNIESIVVREPGYTYIGEKIRTLLLDDELAEGMCPKTELLLFEASRAQLVRELLIPTIQKGIWVLCDRFFDSSTAYQSAARSIDTKTVTKLNKFAAGTCTPDLTVLLDLDPKIANERLQHRKAKKDRIEKESLTFFENVRQKYLRLAKEESNRFFIADALLPAQEISNLVIGKIQNSFLI